MTKILCFKPGVAKSKSAFEPMAQIYRYLEKKYNYNFTIVAAASDTYDHEELHVISISTSIIQKATWKAAQYFNCFPVSAILPKKIDQHFQRADGVVTVDPTSRQAGIIGVKKAVETGTPVWFDAGRTTIKPFEGYLWKLRHRVFARAVHDATGIIVTSPKVLEYFGDINLINEKIAEKFTVLGHPTDTAEFHPRESTNSSNKNIQILTISRLVPEKGLYYILEALDPILSEQDNIQFNIIGEGPMKPLLRREIQTRGLSNSINLEGTVSHSQVPTILRNADIFINHSVDVAGWEEFFGAANIEAMACGLPCVLSDSGSIPYVARAPDGIKLVQQRDVVDLRKNVEDLINSPSKRSKMGHQARNFVEQNYSIEAISEKYHQMLQRGLES